MYTPFSNMNTDAITSADQELGSLLETLEENRDIVVVENAEAWEDDEKAPQAAPGEKLKVPGSIVSIAERLDDELTRSLQHIDPHAAEYIERLTDEQSLYNKIVRVMLYVEELSSDSKLEVPQDAINRVVMRRVEHIYFKVWHAFNDMISFLTISSAVAGGHDIGGPGHEIHSRGTRFQDHPS